MTPLELRDLFRADVIDEATPYLWSDLEVYAYMSDAESMFCRLTGGLQDSTSALTELGVVIAEATAELSNKILHIRGASLRSTECDVLVLNYEDFSSTDKRRYTREYMNTPGPVGALVVGMDEGLVRFVQLPEEADTIDLVIERLPLAELDEDATFEIAAHHHQALLSWMRHRAYRKQGADTFDKTKSDEEKAEFVGYCALAKSEKDRRKQKPRLIAYGGL